MIQFVIMVRRWLQTYALLHDLVDIQFHFKTHQSALHMQRRCSPTRQKEKSLLSWARQGGARLGCAIAVAIIASVNSAHGNESPLSSRHASQSNSEYANHQRKQCGDLIVVGFNESMSEPIPVTPETVEHGRTLFFVITFCVAITGIVAWLFS